MNDEAKRVDVVVDATMARITTKALARAAIASVRELDLVLDELRALAASYDAGRISLADVRRQSTEHERFLLARYVRPMPREVKRLFDDLVDSDVTQADGYSYRTKHGLLPGAEIAGPLTRMDQTDDGGWRMRFASRWPWRVRPKLDKQTGAILVAGIRDDPLFAENDEERMRLARVEEPSAPRRRSYRDDDEIDS